GCQSRLALVLAPPAQFGLARSCRRPRQRMMTWLCRSSAMTIWMRSSRNATVVRHSICKEVGLPPVRERRQRPYPDGTRRRAMRECSHCHKPLTPQEFVKETSKGMELERKALGLEGIRFLYYQCARCGYADIFVDVHAIEGEPTDQFHQRRRELDAAV